MKHITLKTTVILCFVLKPLLFLAQVPGMKAYTQLDGYPGTVGFVINQDEKGFIWIGTDNGAVLFDGKRFKVFDDRTGLIDKEILVALPLKENRVLFMPLLNNVSYYENGKLITAKQNKQLGLLKNKTLNHSFFDMATGKAWVSDNVNTDTLMCIGIDTIQFKKIKLKEGFGVIGVSNNKVYLQTLGSKKKIMGVYDTEKHTLDTLFGPTTNDFNCHATTDCKYVLVNFLNESSVLLLEVMGEGRVKKLWERKVKGGLKQTIIDRNYHLWITRTGGGLEYWGLVNAKKLQEPLVFLEDISINYVFVDKDNNKWFTTKDEGLLFISEKHWDNALLLKKLKLPPLLPLTITGDKKGRIFIGYSKPALSVLENGTTKTIQLPPFDFESGVKILQNINENLCLGSNSTLYFFPSAKTDLKYLKKYSLVGFSIKEILTYDDKQLMVATHNSVLLVNPNKNQTFTSPAYIFGSRATCSYHSASGVHLFGTPNGLFTSNEWTHDAHKINDSVLSIAHITEITEVTNGFVLVGTSVKGLFSYQLATGKAQQISKGDMPGTGAIRKIYIQNDTLCWLATDRGVFRIRFDKQLKVKEIENYTFFDGLPSNNTSGLLVKNDTLYVATAAGIGILPIHAVSKNAVKKPISWIVSARVGDTVFHFPKSLSLSYLQNDVQVSLSTISYESIGNIKYQYQLEGLSHNWVETESPEIGFSGLSPGNYRLVVRAINFKGIKSDALLVLPITIEPAFWQTVWFRWVLAILGTSVVFWVIFRMVVRQKNEQYRKIQQKRKLAQLELEAIKAQINPHFIYNCLNSIQYFSYKNDYGPVNQYIELFAKLIRQTMQFSQETFITLDEEIDYLENYLKLEQIRFKEKLTYHLDVQKDIPGNTLIPSMLIQPYIENALKHGVARLSGNGKILITISKYGHEGMKIAIEDNGPGLINKTSQTGKTHLGMRLAGSRAETYNQLFGLDISVTFKTRDATTNNPGLMVELLIPPISNEHTKF